MEPGGAGAGGSGLGALGRRWGRGPAGRAAGGRGRRGAAAHRWEGAAGEGALQRDRRERERGGNAAAPFPWRLAPHAQRHPQPVGSRARPHAHPRRRPHGCKPAHSPAPAPCQGAAGHPRAGEGCCGPAASTPLRSRGIRWHPPLLPTQRTLRRLQSPGSSAPVLPHSSVPRGVPGRMRDAWSQRPAACGTWHLWEHMHHGHR